MTIEVRTLHESHQCRTCDAVITIPYVSADRYGWHGDGDICLGPECLNVDEATGDHGTDVHSDDWWQGFTEGGRRAQEADRWTGG